MQAEVAVVIPSAGRPELGRAISGVFEQDIIGRLQILIGIDVGGKTPEGLEELLARRPPHVSVDVLHLPYSTSERHGGVHPPKDGGALRTLLSYLANSRYVAYLDDDNRWTRSHLRLLRHAIVNRAFAFSRRVLVDEVTRAVVAVDIWDSVGPNRGRFAELGGFVDPSCLMVNKLAIGPALGRWAQTASGAVEPAADLWFFRGLKGMTYGDTGEATVEYSVRSTNVLLQLSALKLSPEEARRRYPAFVAKRARSPYD